MDWTSRQNGNFSAPATWAAGFSILSITSSTKTIVVSTDASALAGQGLVIQGTGVPGVDGFYSAASADFNGTNTTIITNQAIVADVGSVGTVYAYPTTPSTGDNVIIVTQVHMDVSAPDLLTLVVDTGGRIDATGVTFDPFTAMALGGHIIEVQNSATLLDLSTEVNVQTDGAVFTNMTLKDGSDNNPSVTVNSGNLSWSGELDSGGGNLTINGGSLVGGDLTVTNVSEVDFNGGSLTGNIVFENTVGFGDMSGGVLPVTIGGAGTITFKQNVNLSVFQTGQLILNGTIIADNGIRIPTVDPSSGATIDITSKAGGFFWGSISVFYTGPVGQTGGIGGSNSMRIGL